MEVNLESIENQITGVINGIVSGDNSKSLWATATNALRKEESTVKDGISADLQGLAKTQYEDMLQILGVDANNVNDAETIAKKVTWETTSAVHDMFAAAGVVNSNGFYSTFERYASDLEKAIDKAEDSGDYEAEMDEYVKNTTGAGIVYKDDSGRAKGLSSGVSYAMRKAESEVNIALAESLAEEMGADGMYISWHPDHRPSHDFGGQTFTMEEYEEEILPQLEEPNCRHMAYPVFLDSFDMTAIPDHLRSSNTLEIKLPDYFSDEFNDIIKALKSNAPMENTGDLFGRGSYAYYYLSFLKEQYNTETNPTKKKEILTQIKSAEQKYISQLSDTKLTGLPEKFFDKDNVQGIWTSPVDAVQKYAGYANIYDTVFAAVKDTNIFKTEFLYNGNTYRLEFWKSDYSVPVVNMGMGAEIGFYYKNNSSYIEKDVKQYEAVNEDDYLKMSFSLYDRSNSDNEELLFTRYPQDHWWLTGFKPDADNIKSSELHMIGEISFKDEDMKNAFINEYNKTSNNKKNGMTIKESSVDSKRIYFDWLTN